MKVRAGILALLVLSLCACENESGRLQAYAARATGPGGRAAAAVEIAAAFASDTISFDAALTMAFDGIEPASGDVTKSAGATAFAGAVLDAIGQYQSKMAQGGEFEFFWMRVGGLAFKAAEEAHASNRLAEARSLVLAGGSRWQNETYWNQRPDHDALTAVILAKSGEKTEAISRLRSRANLNPPADQVLEMLQGQP